MHCLSVLRPRTIRLIAAAFLLSIATAPLVDATAGDATPQQIAKAREAFREGVSLEAANDWSGALTKFEAVASVRMTPQVRFHIARCQHKLGKLLEALGGYRMAAHEASQSKDPKAPEVLRESSEGLAEVEQKIPKLIIIRGKGTEAGGISLDGVALGETSIGKEVPVNPGGHTIEFKDPDGKSNRVVITLSEGETRKIDLIQEASKPPPPPPTQSAAPTQSAPPPLPPEPGPKVLPWVVVGIGGASLIASGAFYLLRSKAISDLDGKCIDTRCPASMQDTGDKGKMYTTLGNVTLGLGVVGLGVGTVLLLTGNKSSSPDAPAKKESTAKTRMTVVFGGSSHSGEASLVGTF